MIVLLQGFCPMTSSYVSRRSRNTYYSPCGSWIALPALSFVWLHKIHTIILFAKRFLKQLNSFIFAFVCMCTNVCGLGEAAYGREETGEVTGVMGQGDAGWGLRLHGEGWGKIGVRV